MVESVIFRYSTFHISSRLHLRAPSDRVFCLVLSTVRSPFCRKGKKEKEKKLKGFTRMTRTNREELPSFFTLTEARPGIEPGTC